MRLILDSIAGGRGGEILFSDISFVLESGQGLQITGVNGSGKSTLLRIIAGLIAPETGTITFENSADKSMSDLAAQLDYLGHQNAMKPALTVKENLQFWSTFSGGKPSDVENAIALTDLEKLADLPFSYLSAGQKRRTAIARLLAAPRPIWLLDEPTAALDAATTKRFSSIMDDHLKCGGMIIAATHLPLGVVGWQDLEITPPQQKRTS